MSGTPIANGSYSFTLTARGFGACTGSRAYTTPIGDGSNCSSITLPSLPNGWPGPLYNYSVAATPAGNYSYAVTAGALPPGVTLYESIGRVFGYPTRAGSYSFTISATNGNQCAGQRSYTLNLGSVSVAQRAVAGDFDGDSKSDLAVWRGLQSEWLVLKSADNQLSTMLWGAAYAPYNDVVATADYDGDGKMDWAVYRRATGHFYVKWSSNGALLDHAPGAGDVPVAADYDGDGKADSAVWRGATGNWYVLRSSDGNSQSVQWGAAWAGDVAVPGDYDGDGKCDWAVWREPEGKWYVRQSSDQATRVQSHGQRGDQPVMYSGLSVR